MVVEQPQAGYLHELLAHGHLAYGGVSDKKQQFHNNSLYYIISVFSRAAHGVGTLVRGFEEGHQPPGGCHA